MLRHTRAALLGLEDIVTRNFFVAFPTDRD